MLFEERCDVCIFKFYLMFKGALRNEKSINASSLDFHSVMPRTVMTFNDA